MPWEMRWFYSGTNQDFENQFKALDDNFIEEPPRDDNYIQSSSDSIGIKVRQGNLEIKLRRHSPNILEKGNVNGMIEEWVKWIWSGEPSETTDARTAFINEITKGPVVSVHKRRLIRRYQIKNDSISSIKGMIPEGLTGFGCEFTKIKLNEMDWWSFGFEGVGPDISLDSFKNFVVEVASEFSFGFSMENSCSYPKWITINRR